MPDRKIKVEVVLQVSADEAWEFYTNPQHIMKWNFASDKWKCPSASNDLTVGGRHFARMEAKDGSLGFDFEATYSEIEIGKNFKYTMPDGRKLSAKFDDLAGHTKLALCFDPDEEYAREMQQEGWQKILNNFKKYVESQ